MSVLSSLLDEILDWCSGTIDGLLIEISSPKNWQIIFFFACSVTKLGASASSYVYHCKNQNSFHIQKYMEKLLPEHMLPVSQPHWTKRPVQDKKEAATIHTQLQSIAMKYL
jgi:hypothetical protein